MGGMGVIAALLAVHRHRAGYGTDPADVGKLQKVCGGFVVATVLATAVFHTRAAERGSVKALDQLRTARQVGRAVHREVWGFIWRRQDRHLAATLVLVLTMCSSAGHDGSQLARCQLEVKRCPSLGTASAVPVLCSCSWPGSVPYNS